MRNLNALTKRRTHDAAGRKIQQGIGLAVGCFIISGASLFGQALPLAACVVAALPMGRNALAAAFGAVAGYFLRCEAAFAAEYAAFTILMLAALAVFQGTRLVYMRWFMPSMASSVCAVLGGISVLGGELQISFLLSKILLSFVATAAFRRAFSGNKSTAWALIGALVSGLSGLNLPFDLGILCACMLCTGGAQIAQAALLGLALDLTGLYAQCAMPALILPALFCRKLSKSEVLLPAVTFALLPPVVFACFGSLRFGVAVASIGGAALGILLRNTAPSFFFVQTGDRANERLCEASKLMDMLSRYLPENVWSVPHSEAEEVYDAAAERICRCCPRFHRCWEHHAAETYEALSAAAHTIIERGMARTEDFTASFQENCCHLEGFVMAVNQELEGMLYRRRYRMLMRESRQVFSQELRCIAQYLRRLQDEPRTKTDTVFLPQVGISALSKRGERISGDCGAYFVGANAEFYVLLCDGMGSGEPAALGSNETVQILQRLLKGGLDAPDALNILNGMQILREAQSYTTVDLACIDLNTGAARLYKWGAAPSYLRHFDTIKKIGTASAPPGVSICSRAEELSCSLKHEELLVLASDGADSGQIESVLSSYRGNSPRELAALFAANAQGEDDATVVAVSLQIRNNAHGTP